MARMTMEQIEMEPLSVVLKTLGSAEGSMPRFWYDDVNHKNKDGTMAVAFPRHRKPDVVEGDRLVIYLSGWQKVVGIMDVETDPKNDGGKRFSERWPWLVTCSPVLLVLDAKRAPHVTECGVRTLSVRSQSHIFLTTEQYRQSVAALASAAAYNGEVYVPAYAPPPAV